jgi:hypothetical protein
MTDVSILSYADNLEYVDTSDYHALVAPRPLIVQTGKQDDVYSKFTPPFAGDNHIQSIA